MCGIFALLCVKESKRDSLLIPKLLSVLDDRSLRNRGPDVVRTVIKRYASFSFYRLAIMDTSIRGMQPFTSDLGDIVMMCNGEIFNYKLLIEKYGLECESESDCEVILRMYEKFGFRETVKQLDGDFAIVIYDEKDKKLYLACDRIGVRPLFIGTIGIGESLFIAVSSTPHPILSLYNNGLNEIKPTEISINPVSPNMVQSISLITFNISEEIYEPLKFHTIPSYPMSYLRETLFRSVQKRLMSDRPIGCLLSGGLDSSVIAFILTTFLGRGRVNTYSIGMEGSVDLNYARKVATHLGTNHTEIKFTPEEGLAVIPEVIRCLGSYDITTVRASVGMYLISRYISIYTDNKVIFSGEGSDELFCGYLYFHNAPNNEELEQESERLISELYNYDVLRADRTVSNFGLELRVPFLDKDMINLALNCSGEDKKPINGYEKNYLRLCFQNDLPIDVVWRRKDGFSDAVSGLDKPWCQYITEYCDSKIGDEFFDLSFPSKEAMYYYLIFCKEFPNYHLQNHIISKNMEKYNSRLEYWMPKWCGDVKDPSGRKLEMYDEHSL